MNALQYWLEKHLVPVAAKIGSQKHLVALRDSFVGMMPATMVGAMATLVSVLIGTVPAAVQQFVQRGASDGSWTLSHTPVFEQLAGISNVVSQGTLTVIGLIFAFSWGYNLSKAYKVNELAGGIVGVAALISGLPNILSLATAGLSEKAMTTVNNNIAA
ncbi:MAG: PTS sugar transporter subunit IIC, partial [Lactococcus raffinolactis]